MTPQFITSMSHGHQHWSNLDHKYSVSVQATVQGNYKLIIHEWEFEVYPCDFFCKNC